MREEARGAKVDTESRKVRILIAVVVAIIIAYIQRADLRSWSVETAAKIREAIATNTPTPEPTPITVSRISTRLAVYNIVEANGNTRRVCDTLNEAIADAKPGESIVIDLTRE